MTDHPRGSLAAALHARKNEDIGEILIAWGAYRVGDFVFAEKSPDGTFTVSLPMTPSQICAERIRGSLLRGYLTMMSVPASHVRIVLPFEALRQKELTT